MALRTNRLNAQSYANCIFAGGAERAAVRRLDLLKNLYAGEGGIEDKSGVPNGYGTGALLLPLKAGGLSSYGQSTITFTGSGNAAAGRNLEGTAAITLTVSNAQLDQIVSLLGSAGIAFSTSGSASGAANASGSTSITFSVPASILGGVFSTSGSTSFTVSSNSVLTALGFMETDTTPATLTAASIAQAVWEAIAAEYNISGTMGVELKKKLNLSDYIGLG